MTFRLSAASALCTILLSSHALASAENEYTLSEAEMNATVTTYQPQPYVAEPAPTAYQPADAGSAAGLGEIVYDTQPYYPDSASDGTQAYTLDTTQPYAAPADAQVYLPAQGQAYQPMQDQGYQPAAQQPVYQPLVTN